MDDQHDWARFDELDIQIRTKHKTLADMARGLRVEDEYAASKRLLRRFDNARAQFNIIGDDVYVTRGVEVDVDGQTCQGTAWRLVTTPNEFVELWDEGFRPR